MTNISTTLSKLIKLRHKLALHREPEGVTIIGIPKPPSKLMLKYKEKRADLINELITEATEQDESPKRTATLNVLYRELSFLEEISADIDLLADEREEIKEKILSDKLPDIFAKKLSEHGVMPPKSFC